MRNEFSVEGMRCAGCQSRVEKAVSELSGVEECTVSLLTNSMSVEGTAEPKEIMTAVKAAGFKAKLLKKNESDTDSPIKQMTVRLVASVIMSVPLMVFCYRGLFVYAQLLLSTAIILINYSFFINGTKGIIHKAPNMDTLVALGSLVSYVYSLWALFSGNAHTHLYFDSSGMILTFISIGKLLETISKGRTTNAIDNLKALSIGEAVLVVDGKEITVPAADIKVGDVFIVRQGNSFPADGDVIEGDAEVDESSLTGESILINKAPGDKVYTSTLLMKGEIKCMATKVGEDTFLASIIDMVSRAGASKAPISRTADRIASIFVPVILGLSVATFLLWLLVFKDADGAVTLSRAVQRGVSVMVISCPCALGLATPVAVMVGTGVGAKNKILYKNATALETAAKVNHIVFDKTGTLTYGDLTKEDSLKSDSKQAVKELLEMGYEVTMLTGDKKEKAEKIADEAMISNVIYEVLPGQKEEVVSSLMEEGKKVMMVGDGINDAVALTRADVGVAIGTGKDIAIDSADIVLLNSSVKDVVKLIKVSRTTLKIIYQNYFWALIYNCVGIPLAACSTISPMFCALAMSLSSFCVVMNALRLNLKKF